MRWIVCFHKRQAGRFLAKLLAIQAKIHALLPCEVRSAQRDVEFTGVSHWWIPFFSQKGRKADPMVSKMLTDAVCIEVTPKRQRQWLPRFTFQGLYCVSFCKHAVGITKWTIFTPDQLYCELLKQGGQEIFVWNEENA